ncbi:MULTISPECIES: aspartate 1-decarboxylase [Methylomonas]|uniref:aspartate 1-decarboxylase n=1 Tax=Methylomonas TaxID=416 RepID=UPI001231F2BD|nr:aspartate 1-decarboxylase [Methylomonas rhizoryzae]
MHINMLKAKLHRARVTHSELDYEGSCAIDGDILDLSGILEYEQIHIYNINNGQRFTTYAIRAENGSGVFSINGAAARLACPGDLIIVCAFASLDEAELKNYQPVLVYFEAGNKVSHCSHSIPVQAA